MQNTTPHRFAADACPWADNIPTANSANSAATMPNEAHRPVAGKNKRLAPAAPAAPASVLMDVVRPTPSRSGELRHGVGHERLRFPGECGPRSVADTQTREVGREDHGGRVDGVPEEQTDLPGPGDFVNEGSRSGEEGDEIDQTNSQAAFHLRMLGFGLVAHRDCLEAANAHGANAGH